VQHLLILVAALMLGDTPGASSAAGEPSARAIPYRSHEWFETVKISTRRILDLGASRVLVRSIHPTAEWQQDKPPPRIKSFSAGGMAGGGTLIKFVVGWRGGIIGREHDTEVEWRVYSDNCSGLTLVRDTGPVQPTEERFAMASRFFERQVCRRVLESVQNGGSVAVNPFITDAEEPK